MSTADESDAKTIRELTVRQQIRREIGDFVKLILWFLILFFVIKTYVIEGYEVQGPSMIPTLQDGERILVLKLPHILSQFRVFRGFDAITAKDIVVFDSEEPNKRYVKRVIASGPHRTSGNTVEAEKQGGHASSDPCVRVRFDHGAVYVNNRRVPEDYIPVAERLSHDPPKEWAVPAGGYYVLGDNRGVSKDSRSFGVVDDHRVIGRAVLCFWPLNRFRLLK